MESYCARFYDGYFTGVEGDVDFYVKEARRIGSPILELGCGTGRILLPLARAGVQVIGLDVAGELLAIARRKLAVASPAMRRRVSLIRADMRAFALGRRFRLAIVPYRTFQHLLTPVDQEQALTCIREHLEDHGRLVFNVYDPLCELMADGFQSPLRKDTDFIDPESGNLVVVWYCRHCDPEVQLMEQELIFEEVDGDGRIVGRTSSRLTLRYASSFEIRYLLERCGFAVDSLSGDFQGNPYPGFGEQVWVAHRI